MAFELDQLAANNDSSADFPISADELRRRIDELLTTRSRRYRRLWTYYQNPMLPRSADQDEQGSDRPYRQGQEWGLPSRVTGVRSGDDSSASSQIFGVARKEVVIENDIGWRIDTMVDFLFGKAISITSLVSDPNRRVQIETLLSQIIEQNGGLMLLQQIATLGAVYGFVDVLVKFVNANNEPVEPATDGARPSQGNGQNVSLPPRAESASVSSHDLSTSSGASLLPSHDAQLARIARMIRLEVVEPARALPVLSIQDWRDVRAYAQVYQIQKPQGKSAPRRVAANRGILGRLFRLAATRSGAIRSPADDQVTITEIITPTAWQRYEDETLVDQGTNSLGEIPLVHIQNLAVPFQYSGTSDVEQLLPIQDELNTRLCDRAHRITMQSFKMYLGKGIDGFTDLPVAPGRMWVTDNDSADVIEFGGDPSSPSEDQHITDLREAMDKISAVTPIAAGAIKDRVGNLTSAAALRVTLMALLARTERKRAIYGGGIARLCELALAWLDRAGLFLSSPDERRVEIQWPGLLPDSQMEKLQEAQIKRNLGVPTDEILRELGYANVTASVGTPSEGSSPDSQSNPTPTEPSP